MATPTNTAKKIFFFQPQQHQEDYLRDKSLLKDAAARRITTPLFASNDEDNDADLVTAFSTRRSDNDESKDHDNHHHHDTPTNNPASVVQVWDNVLSPDGCQRIHDLCCDHRERTESSIFILPPTVDQEVDDNHRNNAAADNQQQRLTPLEQAIASVLRGTMKLQTTTTTSLNDSSSSPSSQSPSQPEPTIYVEYWSREEYRNLQAHADIDEARLLAEGALRSPQTGHVLYLLVQKQQQKEKKDDHDNDESDEDNSLLRAPTCVFPQTRVGWNYGRPSANARNGEQDARQPDSNYDATTATSDSSDSSRNHNNQNNLNNEMVVVPAVPGRLLRFEGNAMHAVPKPPTKWLVGERQEEDHQNATALSQNNNNNSMEDDDCDDFDIEDDDWYDDYDDEDWYDDEDIDYSQVERSVLLFNTWIQTPPTNVDPDCVTGRLPDGIELFTDDGDENDDERDPSSNSDGVMSAEEQQWLEWEEEYGPNGQEVQCLAPHQWQSIPILDSTAAMITKGTPQQEQEQQPLAKDGRSSPAKLHISLMGQAHRRLYPTSNVPCTTPIGNEHLTQVLHDKWQPHSVPLEELREGDRNER